MGPDTIHPYGSGVIGWSQVGPVTIGTIDYETRISALESEVNDLRHIVSILQSYFDDLNNPGHIVDITSV